MCDAINRKTNKQCTKTSRWTIPNTLAGHLVMDKDYFMLSGRPVHLCHGHANSWFARCKRGLTLKLMDGGYLSAYNTHKYGSVVIDREDGIYGEKPTIARSWRQVTEVRGHPSEQIKKEFSIQSAT